MSCIFIGHRHDDGGHARAVYQHLSLWFDEKDVFLDHENLCSGEKFRPALAKAIEDSQVFLAVIGPHWLSEKNRERLLCPQDITRGEIRTALEKKIPIMPILCGGADMPPKDKLPEDIAGLCDFQAHTLADRTYKASLNQLIDALRDVHGLKPRYRPPHGVSQACHLGDQKLSAHFADPVGALEKLCRILSDQGTAAVVGQATLHGMGGVGKTQLALKYSKTYQGQYAGVWWFKAQTLMQLEQDFKYFCDANQVGLFEGEAPHHAVSRFLRQQPRWLLVFDNAEAEYGENKERLRPYLPGGDHHLIVTARSSDVMSGAEALPLDVWTEEEALLFLKKRLCGTSESDLRRLSRTLDGLPLALEQACAYLLKTGNSIDAYCNAIEDLEKCSGHLAREAARENGYPYSVLATLSLAFERLSDGAKELLRLCAWCAPEPIPESLFCLTSDHSGTEKTKKDSRLKSVLPEALFKAASDDLLWGETVAELTGFALTQRVDIDLTPPGEKQRQIERALLMHRLTQTAVIHRLGREAGDVPTLIELLRRLFPEDVDSPNEWPLARALAPHVLALEKRFDANRELQQDFYHSLGWLLNPLGCYLRIGPALYSQAKALFQRDLERSKALLGPEHPDTLTIMGNLASTLRAMGDHVGARALNEQALELSKSKLGPEHSNTLRYMNNLALTLRDMGEHAGARALLEQVLELMKSKLNSDHPDTLRCMNNLALTLRDMGEHASARALNEQALELSKSKLGSDHPDTLRCMDNLALTLRDMGEHAEARNLFEQALELSKSKLGPDHPDTLRYMDNLASTLWAMGEHAEARALEEQALELMKSKLGPEHLTTLSSMNNLACMLWAMGDLAGARALIEQVLELRKSNQGSEHPDTLSSMNNLAGMLWAMGDHAGARALIEQVLELSKSKLGSEHLDTTIAAWNLFLALNKMNDRAAAQSIIDEYLVWLFDDKVEIHSAAQREIRDKLRQMLNRSNATESKP